MREIDNIIEEHKRRGKRKKIFTGLKRGIEIASSVSTTLLLLRDNPKTLDYVSVGAAVLNIGIKIQDEISKLNTVDPKNFFDPEIHQLIPYTLEKTIMNFASDQEVLLKNDKFVLTKAYVSNHEVFWIENEKSKEAPFCKRGELDSIIDSLGLLLWKNNGSNNVLLTKTGVLVSSDETLKFKVTETNAMKKLEDRVLKFKNHDTPRSYLLEGPPGTGKTSAMMHLITKLKLKSIRTTLSSIYGGDWQEQGNASSNLDALLRALKPDMIVIDDIDRSHMGEQEMLKLFETARKYCKIIMATCNNKNSMIGAMLRVGRFDDHIEINHLDIEVVQKLLDPDDHDLAIQMSRWPIAYIENYKEVKKIMGKEQARLEIDDMESRILEIDRKTKRENGWSYHPRAKSAVETSEEEEAEESLY